jgi:hypothetical protein
VWGQSLTADPHLLDVIRTAIKQGRLDSIILINPEAETIIRRIAHKEYLKKKLDNMVVHQIKETDLDSVISRLEQILL